MDYLLGVGKILRGFGVAGTRIVELDWTQAVTARGRGTGVELQVTALPARHFSGRSLLTRFETLWSSFVLKGSRHSVYYGADSGAWDGFAEIGREYGPFDLTMLEIGAYNELWKSIHMGPDGAAKAFAAMGGAGLLMPIHWGLFDLALHGWRQPMERMTELADSRGLKLWTPEPGVPTEVIAGREHRSGWWRKQNREMTGCRMDKWLWAARFFKTRSLAVRACELGRIEWNGQPVKPAREVRVGDTLQIKNEAGVFQIEVLVLSDQRGPAPVAQTLYRETEESKERRAKVAEERRAMPRFEPVHEGRPSKRNRREMDHLRGRG